MNYNLGTVMTTVMALKCNEIYNNGTDSFGVMK